MTLVNDLGGETPIAGPHTLQNWSIVATGLQCAHVDDGRDWSLLTAPSQEHPPQQSSKLPVACHFWLYFFASSMHSIVPHHLLFSSFNPLTINLMISKHWPWPNSIMHVESMAITYGKISKVRNYSTLSTTHITHNTKHLHGNILSEKCYLWRMALHMNCT